MFDWLKRRLGTAPPPRRAPGARPRPRGRAAGPRFADTTPLPEVISEGNTQADWSAWEDSVSAVESQLQGLLPTARIYSRETVPSQLDEVDAYASVKRKRDI